MDDDHAPEPSKEALQAELVALRNQLATLEGEASEERSARTRRIRSVSAGVFVVISALLVLVATLGWWVHGVLFDTDEFMAIVEPAITSEAFESQLSETLSEATIDALDLETRLEARLGAVDEFLAQGLIEALDLGDAALAIISRLDIPRFADLADPLATAANSRIEDAIDGLVRSEEFGLVTVGTVRRTHEAAVALVTDELDEYENVYLADGELRLDTLPLVAQALERVIEEGILDGEDLQPPDLSDNPRLAEGLERIGAAVDQRLPDDFGQVTIMDEEQLDALQSAGRTFDRLVWAAVIAAIASVAVTVGVSVRRRRTLIQLALAVLFALGLAAISINRLVAAVQAGISDVGIVETVGVFAGVFTGSLGRVLTLVAVLAAGVGIFAYLAGRPRWLASLIEPVGEPPRQPSELDRFTDRYLEALTVVDVAAVLLVAWVSGLDPWWTTAAVFVFGVALWWAYGARMRVRSTLASEPEPVDASS